MLRPKSATDLLVLVLYLYSDIKVDYFDATVLVDKRVVWLDVHVSDTVLMKIRKALDEAPADLISLTIKFVRMFRDIIRDGGRFG
jgi:hypothetical protein